MNTLLRIEAVNLRYVIDDTEDLSTRRGGSFMLLQVVKELSEAFKNDIAPISQGASIGLFSVQKEAGLLEKVKTFLTDKTKLYHHATFAVDLVKDANFRMAVEKALAANRWQQMNHLNFAANWNEAGEPCVLDEIRPGTDKGHLPGEDGKTKNVSASVKARRDAGKELRQTVYKQILGAEAQLPDFTDDTRSLSTFKPGNEKIPPEYPEVPPNLNGKMAVFYADGNNFGKIQQACQTPEALKQWDEAIREKRKKLLEGLLQWLQENSRAQNGYQLRFETLLWGGDEMLFLLPAWLGLVFAEKFFELTKDWQYNNQPLKHAAGLVFAKHSTPISQLQKLAKELAENGKDSEDLKKQNTVSWVVLESFDNTGNQIKNFWTRNGIPEDGWGKLLLTEGRLAKLRAIEPSKEALPRSALVRVLRTLARGKSLDENEKKLIQRSYQSAEESLQPEHKAVLEKIWADFAPQTQWGASVLESKKENPEETARNWAQEQAIPWTALLELWDYILPTDFSQSTPCTQETIEVNA